MIDHNKVSLIAEFERKITGLKVEYEAEADTARRARTAYWIGALELELAELRGGEMLSAIPAEYLDLTLVEFMTKARKMKGEGMTDLPAPAAEQPGDPNAELAAVVGKDVGEEWTIIGVPFLIAPPYEFGCCVRLKPNQEIK